MTTLGYVGAGNMARALARGIGEPLVAYTPSGAKAQALVAELGGTVATSAVQVADEADAVLLCHKPQQLDAVAAELDGHAGTVISVLGGVPLDALRAAYPDATVVRTLPSTPSEVGEGVTLWAKGSDPAPAVRELLERCGPVVDIDEKQLDVGMALMGNAPAFIALIVESMVDAGVRRGLSVGLAQELTVQTLAGTARLLQAKDHDTLAVRREVTSPGGSTARGLAALERAGVRAAFHDAIDAVLGD